MTPIELARAAADAADDKGAQDPVLIDVAEILSICDVFLIVSAPNTRQVAAIAEEVEEQLFVVADVKPLAVEGLDARRWVLLDYGDLIVHVFLDEERSYYRLERLYGDAPRIDWSPTRPGDLTA